MSEVRLYKDTQLLINGQWKPGRGGKTIDVSNPCNNRVIGVVSHADAQDVNDAADAALAGYTQWSGMPAADRARMLRGAADQLRSRVEDIARLITLEQGKPLREARMEVAMAPDIIEWFADEGCRIYGRVVPPRNGSHIRQLVVKDPVGPVAAFTPWNFPVVQAVRKLAAALASGCSIILKGPEETPASVAALVQAFLDAGVPPSAVSLLYGNPGAISEALISNPIIKKVTFTGSTAVGKHLAALAGLHMKRITMELGGHAPVIVCEDADLDLALKTVGAAKFRNAGQVCTSPTRFIVHRDISTEFSGRLADYADGLVVGDGTDEAVHMGPMANPRRIEAMARLVRDAVDQGADVLAGGGPIARGGNFWQPTVLTGVTPAMAFANEEPFGPMAGLSTFTALDDAIAEANRLSYGLSGYGFTRSLKSADLLSRLVRVGTMWINTAAMPWPEIPFGGLGDSGIGSEGGPEAIESFLVTRSIVTVN